MNAIQFAYIAGFLLSLFTLLPVVYGVFIDGLTTRMRQSFFSLLLIDICWTVTQLTQVVVSNFQISGFAKLFGTIFLCLSVYVNYVFTVMYTDTNWLLKDKWVALSLPFHFSFSA